MIYFIRSVTLNIYESTLLRYAITPSEFILKNSGGNRELFPSHSFVAKLCAVESQPGRDENLAYMSKLIYNF